jgi:hypothetical protein
MKQLGLFNYVINDKLTQLIDQRALLRTTKMKKLRDLFIGIVLNLTCNIEDMEIIRHLVVDLNVLRPMLQVLMDSRCDWPTHGAS